MNIPNDTYARILDVAERVFSEHGFTAASLRDIAARAGIKHASLYYYVPGGKQQLYEIVMERTLLSHRAGMAQAVEGAGPALRDQLRAVGLWLLQQPPLDLIRMQHADLAALEPDAARRLSRLAYDSLRLPLLAVLEAAHARGELDLPNPNLAVMSFVGLVEGVHGNPMQYGDAGPTREQAVDHIIEMLLTGWLPR